LQFSAAGVGNPNVIQPILAVVVGDNVGSDLVPRFHHGSHQWRRDLYGIVIAGMNPGISSCLTVISLVAGFL
jgi:hypothetical protein